MSQLSAVQQQPSAGSAAEHVIALRLESVNELFDALDPAPLLERDLDARAEEFIVASARERPANIPLRLAVRVDGAAASHGARGPRDKISASSSGLAVLVF